MLMVSPTTDDYIYILVGLFLGYLISLNRSGEKENETLDKLDQNMRKELEYYKNLSESLTQDKNELKQKVKELQNELGR